MGLAVLLFPTPALGDAARHTATAPERSAAALAARPSDFATTANGNFSLSQAGPSGALFPGSSLGAQYTISLHTHLANPAPLSVWVPPPMLTFATSAGPVKVFGSWANFTFGGNGSVSSALSATFNLSLTVQTPASFNGTNRTIFSSQLAAIMSSLPYGSVNLSVAWRWMVEGPDGSTAASPWTSSGLIDPAYFVSVESYGPSQLATGGSYGVCLGGPVGGRLFSLHLEVAKPYFDFVRANDTAPVGATSTCWSVTVPQGISPGPLLAHVWSYDRVTLLLYVFRLVLVNATSSGPMTLASPGWKLVVNLSALSFGGMATVALVVLRGRRTRSSAVS